MKRNSLARLITVIVLLILLVVFVTQNLSTVDVYFFVYLGKPAVITVILISLLIGYILGLLTYSLIFKSGSAAAVKKGVETKPEADSIKVPGEKAKTRK